MRRGAFVFWFGTALLVLLLGNAQALNLDNEKATYPSLTNTVVTMTGHSELHLTNSGDPIPGCTINLTSEDSWVFFHAVIPSLTASTLLSRIQINGSPAALDSNVRVVEYVNGSVVVPYPASYQPLEVFSGQQFTGSSKKLTQYTGYGVTNLGFFNDNIRSFVLKRGYTATFAQNPDGSGISKNYVAQDSDLWVSILPPDLDQSISFVRIFPWRWTSKKGSCDVDPVALNARWHYNWNISLNSTLDWEYVAIKQQRWWPGLNEDWKWRGVNHLSGYNEPDNPVEDAYTSLDNGSTTTAVAAWPELLSTGLRVGAPAVTDGGYGWIVDFMNKANAAGVRVDYVPVHYYRAYWNQNDPAGAANDLYNFLKSIHDATGKPVWLTEFNNGANWTNNAYDPTVDQNKNVIEAMINRMDATPWIERYAIYSHVEWFRQTHYDDGTITPMGAMYRDHLSPIAYQQVVPDSGKSPAADYLFEGNTLDTSGNGNNPLIYGTPKLVTGKQGQALSFDGADDYLALPPRLGDSTDFTFSAWVKWNGGSQWQRIFDLGNGTANNLFLTPRSGGDILRFEIVKSGVAGQQLNAPQLPIGVWTHVAVTLSGDTGKLFINGALVATNNGMTLNPVDVGTATNYLGKSQWPDPLFNGSLDSVRFLTYALSDAEVAASASPAILQFDSDPLVLGGAMPMQSYTGSLATHVTTGNGGLTFTKIAGPAWLAVAADGSLTGVPMSADTGKNSLFVRVTDSSGLVDSAMIEIPVAEAPGMVARYPFDTNTTAAVGTAHGTATGGPIYRAGHNANAIVLDGSDDYVTLPAGIANQDEITIATWVLWGGGNQWQRIFDFGNGTGENMFLTPRSGGNTLRFSINKSGVPSQELNAPQLPTGVWTHVAVTLSGGTGKLYVNGVPADTQAVTIKPGDLLASTNFLGKSQWPDPLFNGRLDEFSVFNHALDDAEISALYAGSLPAFYSDPFNKPDAPVDGEYIDSISGSASGASVTYSKAGGPKWLTVEPDGRISGVPSSSDAGINRFIVRATDASGIADDATMNIVVPAPSDLLVHYQFLGNTTDSAGIYYGTPSGGPTYPDAIFDMAIDLDGADDYVTMPSDIFSGLDDITIAARVRWDGGNDWQRIFDFGTGPGAYFFLTPGVGNSLRFAITTGGYGTEQRLNAPSLPVGEWTHIAITLVGNTGTLYVNGAPVDTQTITLNPSNVAPTINYLGKSQFGSDPYFNGAIDDFRIYNYGLGATEVAALAIPPEPVIVNLSPYQTWVNANPFPPGQDLPELDPEFDGISNVWEFLLGTDPFSVDAGILPQAEVLTAADLGLPGDDRYLTVSARLRSNRQGVSVGAEAAATIPGLSLPEAATHAIQAGAPLPDGDFEIITWYYDVPIQNGMSGYIRLRPTVD